MKTVKPSFFLNLMSLVMLAASLGMLTEHSFGFAYLFLFYAWWMREAARMQDRLDAPTVIVNRVHVEETQP